MGQSIHRPVLLNEVIEGLGVGKDMVVLDATFGGGGHSAEILHRFADVRIIAIDQDRNTAAEKNISLHHENFRNLSVVLRKEGLAKVDAIIFDLGLSSDQLENSGRGFSFQKNEPLLMTMKVDPSEEDLTARDILNRWAEESIATIILGYGEERYAKRIAQAIVAERKKKEILATGDLVEIIKRAVPIQYRKGKIHFATRTFQALRIAVNDELGALKEGIREGFTALKPKGRMAVISFHSLEDRIVKRFYKSVVEEKLGKLINKKPITASREEIKENPRARSAKLRIIQKIK